MKTYSQQPWKALLGVFFVACSGDGATQPVEKAAPSPAVASLAAAPAEPLPSSQRELLQLAFDAASKFPVQPHGKNRSRAQEVVVVAAFELGAPEFAVALGAKIADWRRGCAYADFAWAMARRGDGALQLKIARALSALGDVEAAAKASGAIDQASTHAVDAAWNSAAAERVAAMTAERAPAEFAALDQGFATMSLGQQAAAMALVARMHEKFFADAALRRACEERVAVTWDKTMPALRLDALAQMVRACHANADGARAAELLTTMRGIVEGHRWRSEDRTPQASRLIELAQLLGQADRARAEAEAALKAYQDERDGIVDIYRAETLRPLALAWFVLGDRERGDGLYALAIEEGMENPNSRPRCDDLVDACVDLARRGIDPSPKTWARLREIQQGLGEPW